jgi:hypothetical protein
MPVGSWLSCPRRSSKTLRLRGSEHRRQLTKRSRGGWEDRRAKGGADRALGLAGGSSPTAEGPLPSCVAFPVQSGEGRKVLAVVRLSAHLACSCFSLQGRRGSPVCDAAVPIERPHQSFSRGPIFPPAKALSLIDGFARSPFRSPPPWGGDVTGLHNWVYPSPLIIVGQKRARCSRDSGQHERARQ